VIGHEYELKNGAAKNIVHHLALSYDS